MTDLILTYNPNHPGACFVTAGSDPGLDYLGSWTGDDDLRHGDELWLDEAERAAMLADARRCGITVGDGEEDGPFAIRSV